MVHTQYNAKVQVLRSDNGGEYMTSKFQHYLDAHGIIHQTAYLNRPQQNGVAKQKNRHLLEVVRASLIETHMLLFYWDEALSSITYLIYWLLSSTIDFQTPFHARNEEIVTPNITNLPSHVFGCVVFAHLHQHQHKKLTHQVL